MTNQLTAKELNTILSALDCAIERYQDILEEDGANMSPADFKSYYNSINEFQTLLNKIKNNYMTSNEIKTRLDYLRQEIEAERISQAEILELESLKEHIDPADVLLLQWAGVKE